MYSLLYSLKIVKLDWRDGYLDSLGFDSQGYCWNLGRVDLSAALFYCDRPNVEMRWPNGRIRLRSLPLRTPGLSGRELWLQ